MKMTRIRTIRCIIFCLRTMVVATRRIWAPMIYLVMYFSYDLKIMSLLFNPTCIVIKSQLQKDQVNYVS